MDTIQSVVNTPSNAVASKAFVASTYVPYTGAIANVNLGSYDLEANDLTVSTTTSGVGTFGSSFQAIIGDDTNNIAGYFTTSSGFTTVTLADNNRAGEFTAYGTAYAIGATDTTGNIVILADQQYAINSVGYCVFDSAGSTVELNEGTFALKVVGNTLLQDIVIGTITDTAGTPALTIDPNARLLYYDDGLTVAVDWSRNIYNLGVYLETLQVDNIYPANNTFVSIGSNGDTDLKAREIEGVTGFKVNGTQGFTGTGIYVTLTIEGGIITNAV